LCDRNKADRRKRRGRSEREMIKKEEEEKKEYAVFEIGKEKRTLREEDVKDDETGELYRVRELSALKRMKISDASIDYATGEPKVKTEKMQILTLKYGVIKPDFSKQTDEEIEQWLDTKNPVLFTALLAGITKISTLDKKSLQSLRGEELKKNPLLQPSSS